MMPALDGFGLVGALRRHPRTRTVPVILLSARAGEEARIDGLQSGATDLIDGGGIHVIGQVGAFRRLPGRSLPQPRRQHISHDHFVHIFRCDRSPVHGLPNRTTSEFRRAHGAQGAIQVSNGSSHGRGYHGMLH